MSQIRSQAPSLRRLAAVVMPPLVIGAVIWLLVVIPPYQASLVRFEGPDSSKQQAELTNEYRRTIAQVIGGVFVVIGALSGAFFTWRQISVAREGQITDRFTKAIAQLGDDKMAVRLGGIYALERIAKDSPKDQWTIVETLSAFIRENAATQPRTPETQSQRSLRTDIQAALTVLGRRKSVAAESQLMRIDLSHIAAPQADLRDAHLDGAYFYGANLEGADLGGAHLEGAYFGAAHLEGASLRGANLEGAQFDGAHLEGAHLDVAHLKKAHFDGAHLEGVVVTQTLT